MSTPVASGELAIIPLLSSVLGTQLEHCVQFAGYVSGKMWTMGTCQKRTGRKIVEFESITSKQGAERKPDYTRIKIKLVQQFSKYIERLLKGDGEDTVLHSKEGRMGDNVPK